MKIECDITALDPKGSSVVARSATCYEGQYGGDNVLHPALLDLQFEVTENDKAGRAGFEIVLRDAYSTRSVVLHIYYEQDTAR